MNTLMKIVLGAVVAGAVTAVLSKRRSAAASGMPSTAGQGRVPRGSQGYSLEEIAGENREWGGGSAGLNS